MSNIMTVEVHDLIAMLKTITSTGQIKPTAQVWLSSDEEGNSFSPLVKFDNTFNISIEPDKLILYPTHHHVQ